MGRYEFVAALVSVALAAAWISWDLAAWYWRRVSRATDRDRDRVHDEQLRRLEDLRFDIDNVRQRVAKLDRSNGDIVKAFKAFKDHITEDVKRRRRLHAWPPSGPPEEGNN